MATTIDNLKSKVLKRIDETLPQLSDGTVNQFNLDEFLDDATLQILYCAPLYLVPATDFSTAKAEKNSDGSGCVTLPIGFVRLIEFKMVGWERPVLSSITAHSNIYLRQYNKVLRGGVSKPVVAIVGDKLEYYSLPDSVVVHKVEKALCVVRCKATELPELLHEALCWFAASLILGVVNETEASTVARQRYNELITAPYGDNKL